MRRYLNPSTGMLLISALVWAGCAKAPETKVSAPVDQKPTADLTGHDQRFTVALATLDNDPDQRQTKLLLSQLEKIPGVQVLKANLTIQQDKNIPPNEAEQKGHEQGAAFINRCVHVEALLWGEVTQRGEKPALEAFWTPVWKAPSQIRLSDDVEEPFALPVLALDDLARVLDLVVLSKANRYYQGKKAEVTQALISAVDQVSNLTEKQDLMDQWSKTDRGRVRRILGDVLQLNVSLKEPDEVLQSAIDQYEAALEDLDSKTVPLDWASAKYRLATACEKLGSLESTTIDLSQAADAYSDALEVYTAEQNPLKWADIQYKLGGVQEQIGKIRGSGVELSAAVKHYREALTKYSAEAVPFRWAETQYRLGNVLFVLGEKGLDPASLEQAVNAYNAALRIRTRKQVPLEWATIKHNLGSTLLALAMQRSELAPVEQAVKAFSDALKERNRQAAPLDWAKTQNDLGNALLTLGSFKSDIRTVEKAIRSYEQAIEGFSGAEYQVQWAMAMNNMGGALVKLGDLKGDTEVLKKAIAAYRGALEKRPRETVPAQWATSQHSMGDALLNLGTRNGDHEVLTQSVAAYRAALEEFDRQRAPMRWVQLQYALANALSILGYNEKGTERLEQSKEIYREALEVCTRDNDPFQWAKINLSMGSALRFLAERVTNKRKKNAILCDALSAHLNAWSVFRAASEMYAMGTLRAIDKELMLMGSPKQPRCKVFPKELWQQYLQWIESKKKSIPTATIEEEKKTAGPPAEKDEK